jgi:gamma-polyglutamate biosynthesis protein CapC
MLQLFPPHGLDQTIHVAVLLGLWVLLFTTERLGWVWSGLVVPGYLASVFVIQPAAGVTIACESVLTFVAARLVSETASRSGAWSPFFGRERFLLIIVLSVIVRQASQLWLGPELLAAVDARLGTSYRLEQSFSSIGLVLVPLTANMFWKLDVPRGVLQVGVPTLVTYLILRYVLVPFTNLSYSSMELTYENVALDFLASPKAYIILLTGTYVAARYNLLYGWDYAGILMPALLALACFSPLRLVTTAVEAVLLVGVARLLLRLPGLRTMNLEGPRKIVLVFTASFALKYVLGWALAPRLPWGPVLQDLLPAASVTDLYGFGYLVPSLLAAKMLQQEQLGRVLYPTYQAALVALVAGSLIGFGLDRLAPAEGRPAMEAALPPAPTATLYATAGGALAGARVRARLDVAGDGGLRRPYHELDAYAELWRAIAAWLEHGDEERRARVTRLAAARGLALRPLAEPAGAYLLVEAEERLGAQVGWDTAVLLPGAPGPVLEVPRPATEPGAVEAAAALCAPLRCRAILASGVDTAGVGLSEGDALAATWAPLAVAHQQLGQTVVIQLRADEARPRGRAVLHVHNAMPDALASLWPPGEVELSWQPPPGPQQQWDTGRPLAVLRAHPADLFAAALARGPAPPPPIAGQTLEGFLAARLDEQPGEPVPPAVHVPPSETELRFLGEVLGSPLLRRLPDGLPAEERRRLLHGLAGLVGYEVAELTDCAGPGIACWVLAEREARLGWGTLAVLRELGAPVVVEVPRPLREAGTWRLGVELWQSLGARAVLIAPREARVPTADAAAGDNSRTSFQAFHEAAHGSLLEEGSPIILQVRGFGIQQPVDADLVVATGKPLLPGQRAEAVPLDPPWIRLAAALDPSGVLGWLAPRVRYHDAGLDLLELSGVGNPQLHYTTRVGGVALALLWFSDPAREPYVGRPLAREAHRFAAAGISFVVAPAWRALAEPALAPPPVAPSRALAARLAGLVDLARGYAAEENIHVLRALAQRAGGDVAITAGYSQDLRLSWLRFEAREGKEVQRALVLPGGSAGGDVVLTAGGRDLPRVLGAEIFRRPRVIRLHGSLP